MDKLIDLLVKGIKALLQPKILWLIIIAALIFGLAFLFLANQCPEPTPPENSVEQGLQAQVETPAQTATPVSEFLGICKLVYPDPNQKAIPFKSLIGLIALVAGALVIAKVVLWVAGVIKDQFA